MSSNLDRQIARLFCVGFAGKEVDPSLRAMLDRGVGAVVFFARNVGTPGDIAALNADIRRLAGRPILRLVDQEGGRVARLREGFTDLPSMGMLGAADDPAMAESIGRLIGREIASVGFNFDLAPVLDLSTNPESTVIGDRALGCDPSRVASLAAAMIRGIESTGVATCGKHFPGHGDTPLDSHHDLPFLSVDLDQMQRREFVPFRAAIDAGVSSLMPGHLVVESIDPTRPATMSPPVIKGLLRDQLGYDGLVVSDDLEMSAITRNWGIEQCAVEALAAGIDLLVISHHHERAESAMDAVREAIDSGRLPMSRVEQALNRIDRLAAARDSAGDALDWRSILACDEHRRLADAVRVKAKAAHSSHQPGLDPTENWQPKIVRPLAVGRRPSSSKIPR